MTTLEQPKKPAGGAFGQFLAEKRAEFTKACEGQKITAITKMAGEEFKKLSDEEKKPYQEKYEAAKAKFEKDMAAFLEAGGVKSKGLTALRSEKRKAKLDKKNKKDPNAPKRPAGGAYAVFLAEKRPEFQKACAGQPITAVAKMAGEAWKKLSEDAKKPYEATYAENVEKFKAAHAEYIKNNPPPTPAKDEGKGKAGNDTPPAKKRRNVATPPAEAKAKKARVAKVGKDKKVAAPALELDKAVVDEANNLGFAGALRNLAARPEIREKDIPAGKLLAALRENDGLVNKAKTAVLAGA